VIAWHELLAALRLPAMPADIASANRIRDYIVATFAGRAEGLGRAALPDVLRAMTLPSLRRLAADARFDFGCHTMTHAALPFLDAADQRLEIETAQRRLEDELPRVIPVVAYPFGLHDLATARATQRAGLVAGVTMHPRALHRRDSVFALPRIGVSEDWSPAAIALHANAGLRPLFMARTVDGIRV
jgi:peptidoglycan/xylan/chitin deacetylase (PgdA/CDA1 family)